MRSGVMLVQGLDTHAVRWRPPPRGPLRSATRRGLGTWERVRDRRASPEHRSREKDADLQACATPCWPNTTFLPAGRGPAGARPSSSLNGFSFLSSCPAVAAPEDVCRAVLAWLPSRPARISGLGCQSSRREKISIDKRVSVAYLYCPADKVEE